MPFGPQIANPMPHTFCTSPFRKPGSAKVGQAVWPVDSIKDDRRNRLSYLRFCPVSENVSGIGLPTCPTYS
jgi:hypothetical protein